MHFQLIRIPSLFLTGLIAGTFFYGTFTVLPTFYEVPSEIHLGFRTALMGYNRLIVMVLVLLAIATTTIYAWEVRKVRTVRILCLAALMMTIISLAITRFGSVPINMQIKSWNPVSPPSDWLVILEKWDLYNAIRTVTSLGSFICLLLADFRMPKNQ